MNIDDEATETEALFFKAALSHRKNVLLFAGACYNCSEPLDHGVFCDSGCSEDWERRERMLR